MFDRSVSWLSMTTESCLQHYKTKLEIEQLRHPCALSTVVVESVPVVVRQSSRTLEGHVAELLLSLARLQSQPFKMASKYTIHQISDD